MTADEPLYRGMTAAELDRNYNFRAAVPDHAEFFTRWAAESAAVRGRLKGSLDVAYGAHARQRVDLFPAGDGAPLLVFIHGGYWRSLSKEDHTFVAEPFVKAGIGVALIGYGLCPDVTLEELIGHVREGVQWIASMGADHGVNPRRMVVAGHSAGGHLAVTMAETDWTAVGRPRDLIKSAIGISGIYDLEPIRFTFVNEAVRLESEEAARRVSPLRHVPDGPVPPVLLTHGGEESGEVHRLRSEMAQAWRAKGHTAEELVVPGAHHFSVVDHFADPETPLHQATRAMLDAA